MATKQRNYFNNNTGKPINYGNRYSGDDWAFYAESEAIITQEDAEEMQKEAGMSPGGFFLKEFNCEEDKGLFKANWKCISS